VLFKERKEYKREIEHLIKEHSVAIKKERAEAMTLKEQIYQIGVLVS
jgi:hypothetical protein